MNAYTGYFGIFCRVMFALTLPLFMSTAFCFSFGVFGLQPLILLAALPLFFLTRAYVQFGKVHLFFDLCESGLNSIQMIQNPISGIFDDHSFSEEQLQLMYLIVQKLTDLEQARTANKRQELRGELEELLAQDTKVLSAVELHTPIPAYLKPC